MKNIHVISTNKPSRLIIYSTLVNDFRLLAEPTKDWKHKKHIYITSDEETKDGDLCYDLIENDIIKRSNFPDINGYFRKFCRKIILTTDPDLIKDGVQSIDDTFLKWFVKNPNCEIVEITHQLHKDEPLYKIIIPQEKPKQLTDLEIAIKLEEIEREEPKQETLEEYAERFCGIPKHWSGQKHKWSAQDRLLYNTIIESAEWQAEQIPFIIEQYLETAFISKEQGYKNPKDWFEQFKNK